MFQGFFIKTQLRSSWCLKAIFAVREGLWHKKREWLGSIHYRKTDKHFTHGMEIFTLISEFRKSRKNDSSHENHVIIKRQSYEHENGVLNCWMNNLQNIFKTWSAKKNQWNNSSVFLSRDKKNKTISGTTKHISLFSTMPIGYWGCKTAVRVILCPKKMYKVVGKNSWLGERWCWNRINKEDDCWLT